MSREQRNNALVIVGVVLFLGGCVLQSEGPYYMTDYVLGLLMSPVGLLIALGSAGGSTFFKSHPREEGAREGYRTKNNVDWESEAELVNRLFQLSERVFVRVKSESGSETAEMYSRFRYRGHQYYDGLSDNGRWRVGTFATLPSSFEAANANKYASLDYGKDEFLSQVDSDLLVVIYGSNDTTFSAFVGFTNINRAYSITEIRNRINPILRRKGYCCEVTEIGEIARSAVQASVFSSNPTRTEPSSNPKLDHAPRPKPTPKPITTPTPSTKSRTSANSGTKPSNSLNNNPNGYSGRIPDYIMTLEVSPSQLQRGCSYTCNVLDKMWSPTTKSATSTGSGLTRVGFQIPSGSIEGTEVRLAGHGYRVGQRRGDLVFRLRIKPHSAGVSGSPKQAEGYVGQIPPYRTAMGVSASMLRDGGRLTISIPQRIWSPESHNVSAGTGKQTCVAIVIPSESRDGTVLKLKGLGYSCGQRRGDLHVTLKQIM